MEATSIVLPSSHQPVRSISLPTRTHPSSQTLEALLNHLKPIILQHPSSISSSESLLANTIQNNLLLLSDLYNSINHLLQSSSQTQQSLLHNYQSGNKLIEHTLCASLTLLDACGSARDLIMSLKEHVQNLQSSLRRRKASNSTSMEASVCGYVSFRKKAKKEIGKQLSALKRMENNHNKKSSFFEDQSVKFLGRVLREASAITICVFQSLLLLFLSMTGLKRKGSSLMSKLKPMRLLFSSSSSEKEDRDGFNFDDVCCVIGSGSGRNYKNGEEGAKRVLERTVVLEGSLII
ncbi:DUF241 domain protein [Senna tora]|uniref:DUF241 domain protein n=1 Tax=Senna tora TaxID=362788 RepID=A0A834STB2_9FABA|nr:DUF241 domain protein [Senna tora]